MDTPIKTISASISQNCDGTSTLTYVFKQPQSDVYQSEEYLKLRDKNYQLEQRIRTLMQEIDTLKSDQERTQRNLADTEAMMCSLMDDHAPRADYDRATARIAELEAQLARSCNTVDQPTVYSTGCDCKVYQLSNIQTSHTREIHAVSFTVNGHRCLLSMPADWDVKLPSAELSRPWKQWFMASNHFEAVKIFKALSTSGNTASMSGLYFKWSVNKNPHQYMPVVEAKQILLHFLDRNLRLSLKQSITLGRCLCNQSFKYGGSHTTTSSNENIIHQFYGAVTYGVSAFLNVPYPSNNDEVLMTVSLSGVMTTSVANLTDWPPTLKVSWANKAAWTVAPTYTTWPTGTGPVTVYGGMATYNFNISLPIHVPDTFSTSFTIDTVGSTASVVCTLIVSVEPMLPVTSVSSVDTVGDVDVVNRVEFVNVVDEIASVVPVDINTFPVWTNSQRPTKGFRYDQVYTEKEPEDDIAALLDAFKFGGSNNTKGNEQMMPKVPEEPYIPLKANAVKKFSYSLLEEDATGLTPVIMTTTQVHDWASSLGITLPQNYKSYYVMLVEEEFEFCDFNPQPIPDIQVAESSVKAIANDPGVKDKHKQKLIDGVAAKGKKKKKEEQFENVVQRLKSEKVKDFPSYCNTVFGTEGNLNKTRPVNFNFMKKLAAGLEFTVDEYGVLMSIMARSVLVDAPGPQVVRAWGLWLKDKMQYTTYDKICKEHFSSDKIRRVNESYIYGGCNNTKGNEQITTNFSYIYGGCNNTKGNEQTTTEDTKPKSEAQVTLWNSATPNLLESGFSQMYMKVQSGLPEITTLQSPSIPLEKVSATGVAANQNVVPLTRRVYRILDDGAAGVMQDVPLIDIATFMATNVTEVFIDAEMAPLLKADTRRIPNIANDFGLLLPDIRFIPQTKVKTGCCNALLALKFLLNWYTRFPYLDAALGTDGHNLSTAWSGNAHQHSQKSVLVGFNNEPIFPFMNEEPIVYFYSSFAAQTTHGATGAFFIPRNMATHKRWEQLLAITLLVLSPWPNGAWVFQDPLANTLIDYPWEWIRIRSSHIVRIILPTLVDCAIPDTFSDSTTPLIRTGPAPFGPLNADDDLTADVGNYDDDPTGVPLLAFLKTWVGSLQKEDFVDWLNLQPWINKEELDFAMHLEAQACTWDEPVSIGGVNLPLRRNFGPVTADSQASHYGSIVPPFTLWGHMPQFEAGYMNLLATGLAPRSGTDPELEPSWTAYQSYSYWSRVAISHFFHASTYLSVARYGVDALVFRNVTRPTSFSALMQKIRTRQNKWKGQLAGQYRNLYNKLSKCKTPTIPWNDAVLGPVTWTTFDVWQIQPDLARTIPTTVMLHPMVNNGFYLVYCQHVHPFGSLPGPWQKEVIWKGETCPPRGAFGPWLPVDYNIDGTLGTGAKWFDAHFCEYMFKNSWISVVGTYGLRATLSIASRYGNYFITAGQVWLATVRLQPGVGLASEYDYLLLPILYTFAGDAIAPNAFVDTQGTVNGPLYLAAKENLKGIAGWKTAIYPKEGSTYTESLDTGDLGSEIQWNTEEDHVAVKNQTETSVSSN